MGSSEPLLGARLAKIGAEAPIYPRIFVLKNAFRNSQNLLFKILEIAVNDGFWYNGCK